MLLPHPTALRRIALTLFGTLILSAPISAADWIHWRGPEQTGQSREKNLPGSFDPRAKQKGNVLWEQPYGGRSAPLVMDGRIYIIQGFGEGIGESERVVCFDEKSGKLLWEHVVGIYHTDIVSSRLGWTTLTADPATGNVFAHTTAGELLCLNKEGKVLWNRQLTEELGRVTGYGGRVVTPIFDSGLVIVGMMNANWGDQARGLNRMVAFDAKTGEIVWWSTLNPTTQYGTYYSSPVIAVVNGQRLLFTGGADGGLHALKVRTGEKVWTLPLAKGVINGSPVVDGNRVYCNHGESNIDGAPVGRVFCVDAGEVDPATKQPKMIWDSFRRNYKVNRGQPLSERFGLASAALADGLLYCPSDSGELYCFKASDGELLWKYRYATEVRGSPLVADGKLYIFDVKGRMLILTLNGEKEPDRDDTFEIKFRDPRGLLNETNGTPIAVNGRLYFTTRTHLYCVGDPDAKPECGPYKELAAETPFKENAIAGVRLFPAEVSTKAGGKVPLRVVYLDANGREVQDNRPSPPQKWELSLPPKTPKGAQPPALQGAIESGVLTVGPQPSQEGFVDFQSGDLKARARVRVVAQLPVMQNFDKIPPGGAPGGWINANGKFQVEKLPDGAIVLSKLNLAPQPPLARANGYITSPGASNYTIQADVLGTEVREKLPDIGLVNSRYTMILDGKVDPEFKHRQLRLVTWEARPRINEAINFDWEPDTWYTAKFSVEQKEKTSVLRAKVWKRGTPEPEKWMIEFEDSNPNRNGAAAVYGYIPNILPQENGTSLPGSNIYYDNVMITSNGKS